MLGYKAGKKVKAVYRPQLPLIITSIILGCLCFIVFWYFTGGNLGFKDLFTTPQSRSESLLILTIDKSIPPELAAEQLINTGFADFYSESTTQIYMDDFGQWQVFFLDEFNQRVMPFDPRNTGYAERLRSFFINENGQHFFIPLENTMNYGTVQRNISLAMNTLTVSASNIGDEFFSIEILGSVNPFFFWLILQSAAILVVFFLSSEKWRFILYIPLLLTFSLGAIPGIILSGLLYGFMELFKEPLEELFSREPYGNFRERFSPYKKTIIWLLILFILYIFLGILLEIHFIPVLFGLICFFGITFLSYIWKKKPGRKSKDIRGSFSTVIILHFRQKSVILPKSMAIFAIFALFGTFLLFIPGFSSYFNRTEKRDFLNLPSASEYYEYMTYQALFSYLPMGSVNGGYFNYYLGEDGLITGDENTHFDIDPEIPDFPLERLTQFLLNYDDDSKDNSIHYIKEWISVALILFLFIPRFIF